MKAMRIAAFASGRGSNFAAILKRSQSDPTFPKLVTLVSDRADAKALEIARASGIATFVVSYKEGKARAEQAILAHLREIGPDLIVLCGYMRLLGAEVVRAFRGRILNIHPSLLPAFPGLHAQRQALEYGVRVSGCTVHLVDEGMDTGKILAQAAVPVLPNDTEDCLSERILVEEHRLYSDTIAEIAKKGDASGKVL